MKPKYTAIVPYELAVKLRDIGYPQNIGHNWYDNKGSLVKVLPFNDEVNAPTYAEVLDWLADKEIYPEVNAYPVASQSKGWYTEYEAVVVDARKGAGEIRTKIEGEHSPFSGEYEDWCECCADAIEKALDIIRKENDKKEEHGEE